MKVKTKEVRSKQKVLGEAEYKEYDSLAEASSDMGEAAALEALNAQVKTNALNRFRSLKGGTPSKAMLQPKAIANILARDPSAFSNCGGDEAAINDLIANEVARLLKEHEASAPPSSSDESEDED